MAAGTTEETLAPPIAGILIDTTVLIDLSHGHEGAASFINEQRKTGTAIHISVISSMELIVGCFNKAEVDRSQKLIEALWDFMWLTFWLFGISCG